MATIVAIDGPRSIATPNTVFDCCFGDATAIEVVGLRSGWCSIVNNNVNPFSSIKTIANTASFPSLNRLYIRVLVIGLSWWMGMSSGINAVDVADGVQYGVVANDDVTLTC